MVIALLILIVLILLFGAAAVKGWLRSGLILGVSLVGLLLAIGFVKTRYDDWQTDKQLKAAHDELVGEAKKQTLAIIAKAAEKPERDLSITVLHTSYEHFVMCGDILGTKGFGGREGRQRFLSNGGGTTLIESQGDKTAFDKKAAEFCVPGFDNEV